MSRFFFRAGKTVVIEERGGDDPIPARTGEPGRH
jgi:hypothetical protein